ncbi:hypothetical protein ACPPVT_03385 [Angustibacter sp. McL0619]|uniref:hypothetical protein n=1 Tax=Angustibacter sp. McL0619 TaxID=3415676 RepID=UPI003CF85971
MATLHQLLLRLASSGQDELVRECRGLLAGGDTRELTEVLATGLLIAREQLTLDELGVLRSTLDESDPAVALLDEVGVSDEAGVLAASARTARLWSFSPFVDDDLGMPADLTGPAAGQLDAVDRAVLDVAAADPASVAVWRAWRRPGSGAGWPAPCRIFLVSLAPTATASVAADLANRLARASDGPDGACCMVEVEAAATRPNPYAASARATSALLWARAELPVVRLAREPAEHRPAAASSSTPALLTALRSAPLVVAATERVDDRVDHRRGAVVPTSLRSDGRWVWPESLAYYLEQHGVPLDPELGDHLLEQVAQGDPATAELDEVTRHRVLAAAFGLAAHHEAVTPT